MASSRCIAAVVSCVLYICYGAVMMPAIFKDGVVLQTNSAYGQRPYIFGYAEVNETVSVRMSVPQHGVTSYGATAASDGSWRIELDPLDLEGETNNVTLSVWGSSDPTNVTTINNAAYGDVFFCGGQSNMVMSVGVTFNGTEIASKAWPNIRLYSVIEAGATTPQRDLPAYVNRTWTRCAWSDMPYNEYDKHVCQTWQIAEPNVTDYMSAVCFYTAMYYLQSGAVPPTRVIGLVHSAYSGTAMELWAQQSVLDQCNNVSTQDTRPEVQRAVATLPHTEPSAGLGAEPLPPGNSTLFNAMINPIVGFAFRALLWDQGESNMGQSFELFSCFFQGLIESWRRLWRIGDFAWVYVQLGDQEESSSEWPAYIPTPRDAQSSALPGHSRTMTTGMVAAYDLGDRSSPFAPAHVHARNKTEIGRRMAAMVQHVQMGQQWPAGGWPLPNGTAPLDWSGPWPSSFTAESDGSYSLSFTTLTGQGIYLGPTHDCWECCEADDTFQVLVSNEGKWPTWVNASLSLVPGSPATTVKLVPVKAGTYVAVRYAPSLWPQCAVYSNSNQIPAQTFSSFNITTSVASSVHSSADGSDGAAVEPAAHNVSAAWSTWKGRAIPQPAAGVIASTPPMGWNHWNAYHCNIDDALVRRTADVLVSSGLAALGYQFVNIDDCWQVDRMANGTIIPDPARFPYGMRAVADYVHSKGLKFGVYTAQGSKTCQNRPGAYLHEQLDAATYCSWGLDYLKIDLCGGTMRPVLNTSWSLFHQGFQDCVAQGGRPIVESIEYCQDPSPTGCGPWIGQIANVWRTTGDIQATWDSILSNLDGNNEMAKWTKPGNWADPDMLQIGNPGLSLNEAQAHFTAWCIVAAPLLIGADLVSGIGQAYMDILMAPEVLAVNQDVLGVQGIRVSPANASGTECWAKPLSDGSVAAMLLNRGLEVSPVACTWSEIGLKQPSGAAQVRDLWQRKDLGSFTATYETIVQGHGAVMVKVTQN